MAAFLDVQYLLERTNSADSAGIISCAIQGSKKYKLLVQQLPCNVIMYSTKTNLYIYVSECYNLGKLGS